MFEEFEKIEKKDWIQKANQDLKGANVFDKFDWNFGGLELKHYYDPSDNQHLAYLKAFSNREARDNDPSGEPRFWWNVQQIEVAEERLANEAALVGLQNGADGIHFAIKNTEVNLDVLLKDIEHTYCHLSFEITQAVTYKSVFNYLVNLEGSKNIHLSTSSLDENGLYDLLQSDQEGIRLITLQTELEDQPVLEITEL